MSNPELPGAGDLVELWFSGYDEYYPGTVKATHPPNSFTVLLDDGTSWPVDRVNNIWRYASPPAPKKQPEPPEPSQQPEDDELMPDFDDDRAPLEATADARAQPTPVAPSPHAPTPPVQPKPAAQPTPSIPQPPRRKSGRAFRKSTNAPPTAPERPVEADPLPTPASPPVERRPPVEDIKPPVPRVTRQRRIVQDEEPSVPTTPVRPTRRGRPPIAGTKRPTLDSPGGETWDDSLGKRRKTEVAGIANGLTASPTVDRVTRSGARRDEESVEKLSTKAVTAIAVEAALASAKAVFKPLTEQLLNLRAELEQVSEAAKRAAEEITVEPTRKRRGKSAGSPLSSAADSLQLDLSELLGGGEARIRAYANLSDKEFENFQKLIADQRRGLRELDRILTAARDLGKKAEQNAARDARAARSRTRRG